MPFWSRHGKTLRFFVAAQGILDYKKENYFFLGAIKPAKASATPPPIAKKIAFWGS
jgi:hypothetical protein